MGESKYNFDVVGLGACAVDYIGVTACYPDPDSKNKMEQMHCQGGGPVATALVTLSRLGARVSYLGKLGKNTLSQFVLQEFAKEGVDTSGVIKGKKASPYFAFIAVDQAKCERTIWWTDQGVAHLKPEELSREVITSAKFLHLDEYEMNAGLQAAVWAKEAGVRVVLDAETPEKKGIDKLIKFTDVIIVPEDFALRFTGTVYDVESAAVRLGNLGPSIVVITQGRKGCFCRSAKEKFYQSAFEIDIVDSTGCGDVFHGAFIYGLLQSWSLKTMAEFASAVSALKCRKFGGRAGIPLLEEVSHFLLKRGSAEVKATIRETMVK